jgi:hypothetical protein
MKLACFLLTAILVSAAFLVPVAADPPTTAAAIDPSQSITMDDLKAQFLNKNYRPLLQQISRLQTNKKAMSDFDPFEVAMLKAQTYLCLRMTSQALDTFAFAGNLTSDPASRASAAAAAMLVKRSASLVYTPKHPVSPGGDAAAHPKITYNLTDLQQRPDALAALFNDERVELTPRLIAAEKSPTLPPIAALGKPLAELQTLELAATGNDAYVAQERRTISARALELMRHATDQMTQRVAAIRSSAETIVEIDAPVVQNGRVVGSQLGYSARGLAQGEPEELRSIKTNADKINAAAHELSALLRTKPDEFDKIRTAARQISTDADSILNTDYLTGVTNK